MTTSEDAKLKQDMPIALERVEQASKHLLEASEMLKADPLAAIARKRLIDGSGGECFVMLYSCQSSLVISL